MRLATALRTTGGVWIAPLVLGWVWLVTAHEASNEPAYWAGNTVLVGHTLPFYAPACAAFAAWEAGRLRRAGVHRLGAVRGRYAIAFSVLWPVALLGVAAVVACLITVRLQTGVAHDWPHPGVLAMAGYLIVVHTAVGYGLGMMLPRILATPVILVVDYLCLVMPVTITSPMWLRELTGWLDAPYGDVTITVNPMALVVPMLMATGFLAAVLVSAQIAQWRRNRFVRIGAAAVASAVCLGVFTASAVAPVRNWTGDPPPQARTDAPVCADGSPRVCVPVEAAASLGPLTEASKEVVPRLVGAGLTPPKGSPSSPRRLTSTSRRGGSSSTGTCATWIWRPALRRRLFPSSRRATPPPTSKRATWARSRRGSWSRAAWTRRRSGVSPARSEPPTRAWRPWCGR